ncbi:MAG: glycosyltransferase family 2 protein [Bacteroidales bacterium]|nr:glycosyltransferase family 2 protein [Bacteroidales bacterium]
MTILKVIFWILIFIVFYAYIGYGLLLYILVRMKRLVAGKNQVSQDGTYEPEVTLLITAFNEQDFIEQKVKNSRALKYPSEKMKIVWCTDGSDDGTPELLRKYDNITVFHKNERKGKIHAMNRAAQLVDTPIIIFSDANTDLGKDSVRRIVNMFADPKVGCVSGEKRIYSKAEDSAAGAGEGLYWKYESMLKRWDSELYSVVGAAGELFAVRNELFEDVEPDTLLDDLIISLRIAMKGYTIQYDPEAYAIENASANLKEELKRKVRIAAGGIQSVVRLTPLLNVFKYKTLSFQYISHRVLRWVIAPPALLLIFLFNLIIATHYGLFSGSFYVILFWLQVLFYLMSLLGWYLGNKQIKLKILFVPYYFFIMNYAMFLGFSRYIKKQQQITWERAQRSKG